MNIKSKSGRKRVNNPSPRALYMRNYRRKGRNKYERYLYELDHAFPYPVLTMFDLLKEAAIFYGV